MAMDESILTAVDDGIATLHLNRGADMNALDADSARAIRDAVGDRSQDRLSHRHHIRKTPNLVGPIGWFIAADRPSASAMRVSAGSRMPSSHRRAVA